METMRFNKLSNYLRKFAPIHVKCLEQFSQKIKFYVKLTMPDGSIQPLFRRRRDEQRDGSTGVDNAQPCQAGLRKTLHTKREIIGAGFSFFRIVRLILYIHFFIAGSRTGVIDLVWIQRIALRQLDANRFVFHLCFIVDGFQRVKIRPFRTFSL